MNECVPVINPNSKLSFTAELVGPVQAACYLSRNIERNRVPRKGTIALYAGDMANDRWPETGETVIFDEDGRLVQGQHRLMAVIQSGVATPLSVIRGQSRGVYSALDQGLKRSVADATGIPRKLVESFTPIMEAVGFKRTSVAEKEDFYRAWKAPLSAFVNSGVDLSVRAVGVGPVRAACIARIGTYMSVGVSADTKFHAIHEFRALTTFCEETPVPMEPLTAALRRRLLGESHVAGVKRAEVFWLSFHAFTQQKKQPRTLRVNVDRNDKYREEVLRAHEVFAGLSESSPRTK